jgi:tetratricopeptide (TPR) repeat protein
MQEYLSDGITAARKGDITRAGVLLTWAVQRNPDSEQAWLWLAKCSTSNARRAYCYGRVLSLNPNNLEAQIEYRKICLGRPCPPLSVIKAMLTTQNFNLWTVGSVMVGLLVFVVFLSLLVVLGVFPGPQKTLAFSNLALFSQPASSGSQPAAAAPALLPTRSATPLAKTPTTEVQVTSTPVPPAGLARVMPDIQAAEAMMQQKNYAKALPLWDRVIETVPSYGEAYFQRALCYVGLAGNQNYQTIYWNSTEKARADLDAAIALGYDTDEAFYLRYQILDRLAGKYELRSDREYLYDLALQNLQAAIASGHLDPVAESQVARALFQMQRCQEGMDELQGLLAQAGASTLLPAQYDSLAQGWLCLGDFQNALAMIENGLALEQTPERQWMHAVILYNAGRQDDALVALDELIERKCRLEGHPYPLRALIYLEKGQADLAMADLQVGAAGSWYQAGLRSYVEGRLALDEGNKQAAVMMLQDALITLYWYHHPLYAQIEAELADLGAGPLIPVASFPIKATPMAAAFNTQPVADFSRPETLPGVQGLPLPEPVQASLAEGSGPIDLAPASSVVFLFTAPERVVIQEVQALSLRLVASPVDSGEAPFDVFLWNAETDTWVKIEASWGSTPVERPARFVGQDGRIYASVLYPGRKTAHVTNLGFMLQIKTAEADALVYDIK